MVSDPVCTRLKADFQLYLEFFGSYGQVATAQQVFF